MAKDLGPIGIYRLLNNSYRAIICGGLPRKAFEKCWVLVRSYRVYMLLKNTAAYAAAS